MGKKTWTEEEVKLLKDVYGTMSVRELIDKYFPHKTTTSIRWQVEKYKLGDKDIWREEELETLRILRDKGMPMTKIASVLNRTVDAVRLKASRLGVTLKDKLVQNFDNTSYVNMKSQTDEMENRLLGSVNEEYVKIKLSEEGFEVCTPFMNNHKTDLIILFKSEAIKIQVKSAVYDKGHNRFRVNLKTKDKYGKFVIYKNEDVDFFVVKCNGLNDYYIIPFSVSQTTPHLYLYPHRKKIDMGGINTEVFHNAFHLIENFIQEGEIL